jgi:hypothetical protein
MSLLDLPNEIICIIAHYLLTQGSIKSFMRSHWRFHNLSPVLECLYNRAPENQYKNALRWAFIPGNEELARAMLRLPGSATWYCWDDYKIPLVCAYSEGHMKLVKLSLDHNPSIIHKPNWFSEALKSAILKDHIEILRLLLNVSAPLPRCLICLPWNSLSKSPTSQS